MGFLKIKPYTQTISCGPAVLKMILKFYKIKISEKVIAKIAKTHEKHGTEIVDLEKAFKYFGLKTKTKVNSNFSDLNKYLKKGIPVVIGWYTKGKKGDAESITADGHYSVVIGLDKEHIYLQDPEIGKRRKLRKDDFLIVWMDYYGPYPKTKKDIFLRPMIAVYK
ncbi:MAG: C39 family peptidase [Nanoarchaeota archaeon]|nr:C39 family peptidase [Nanoarchaeota archaeon]